MADRTAPAKRHFTALDGLRGIAAVAVVIFHRRSWGPGGHALDHGYLAVYFFFILSGFVIDHAYTAKLEDGMPFKGFAITRMIRLYPMIILGALLGTAFQAIRYLSHHSTAALLKLPLAAALAILCVPAPAFLEGEPFQLDRPLWSLFYEMLANIVYASILFRLSLKALTRVLFAAMLASLILFERFGSLLVGSKHGELWWGLLGVLPPFIFGMVLNRIRDDRRVPPLPFWAAGVLLLASFVPYNLGDANAAYELVVCLIAYPAIILCAQRAEPGRGWARIATIAGFASYPIYALHYPLLDLSQKAVLGLGLASVVDLIITVAGIVVAGILAAYLIDLPIRTRLSARFSSTTPQLKPE